MSAEKQSPPPSRADGTPRIGILVVNLGSPEAPTPAAVRRYLAQFLSDRRVVDLPRGLWWPILHGIILRTRPARSARLYAEVWTEEGAPLLATARRQAARLETALRGRHPQVKVALGMRYGHPAIAEALAELRAAGVERLLLFPLYPQYSCSTTASTLDALAEAVRELRSVPELRVVNDYHASPGYLDALAASIRDYRAEHGASERLLFSFHGTPRRFLAEGDPYYHQCVATAAGVAERLDLAPEQWQVTFQSRFGREEWLQPYTDVTLRELGAAGVGRVDVLCPGFSADCLETLEEVAITNRRLFLQAGGGEYHYIPALNTRDDHIAALAEVVERHIAGWE